MESRWSEFKSFLSFTQHASAAENPHLLFMCSALRDVEREFNFAFWNSFECLNNNTTAAKSPENSVKNDRKMKEIQRFSILKDDSKFLGKLRKLISSSGVHMTGLVVHQTAYNCFISPTIFTKNRKTSLTLTLKHDPKIKHEQSSRDQLLKLQLWKNQILQDCNFPHLAYTLLCTLAKRVGLHGAGMQSDTQLQCFHLSLDNRAESIC